VRYRLHLMRGTRSGTGEVFDSIYLGYLVFDEDNGPPQSDGNSIHEKTSVMVTELRHNREAN
jgi:hypothetical protein